MQIDQELYANWINSIIQLTKIGEQNGFLGENKEFALTVSSDTEKITMELKIEPTNIVGFPQKIIDTRGK